MDLFEFVKKEKSLSDDDIDFKSWREDIDIELEDNTTILNFAYRDKKKDLILPVLNKVSNKYQLYSGKRRKKKLDKKSKYFETELEKYRNKSIQSINKTQQYAVDNHLDILGASSLLLLNLSNSYVFREEVDQII